MFLHTKFGDNFWKLLPQLDHQLLNNSCDIILKAAIKPKRSASKQQFVFMYYK